MRELHIISSDIVSMIVVFSGPKELGHRKEFENLENCLDSLLDSVELNPKKPINIYLEKFENGVREYVKEKINILFDKPNYL